MDIQKIAIKKIKELENNGEIEKMVEEEIRKGLEKVIQECFGPYSDWRKELQAILDEELELDKSDINIKKYNELISDFVRENLEDKLETTGLNKLDVLIDEEVLGINDDNTMDLQEVVNSYINSQVHFDDEDDYCALSVEEETRFGGYTIRFGPSNEKKEYNFIIKIDEEGKIIRARKKSIFNGEEKIVGGKYNFESIIEKLYLEEVKIINIKDEEYIYTCYNEDVY